MTATYETARWKCMGVREFDGKQAIYWLDGDGKTRVFTDRDVYVTGGVYRVEFQRTDNGGVMRKGQPFYVGDRLAFDDPQLIEWRAAETAAKAILKSKSVERKHAAQNKAVLDELLDPLAELAKTMRTQPERDAFTAHIINRVTKAWWT
jgi:hypothetical protein